MAIDSESTGGRGAGEAWKSLYLAGAVAALTAVVFFRRNCGTELVTFRGFGLFEVPAATPSSAGEWFALLQGDRLIGLVVLDIVDLINYALVGLIFLALYGALRNVGRVGMVVGVAFGFTGIAVNFASNQAFSMLALSDRYAAATTDAQRAGYLAAGEAVMAVHQGTGVYLSLLLVVLAGFLISAVMLRSTAFHKAAAYTGLLANLLILGNFIFLAVAPAWSWILPSLSAPFRLIWYILIAVGLLRLRAGGKTVKSGPEGGP